MPPKRIEAGARVKRIRWVFRCNSAMQATNAPDEIREREAITLFGELLEHCDNFAFQLESAPTTGYIHFQGYFELTLKNRYSWIQNNIRHFEYIQQLKGKPHQGWAYATKQETRLLGPWTYGTCGVVAVDTTWKDALDAETVKEGVAIIRANRPRDFCLYGDRITKNLERHHYKPKVVVPKFKLEDFNLPPLVFSEKTMHVWGPSDCGKTSFVLAHFKNPLVVTHLDTLKLLKKQEVDNPYDAIVFDDMSFNHIPPEAVIQLVDNDLDRHIHVRYGTVEIPAGSRKVFTHNNENIFYKDDLGNEQKIAINRRIDYFEVRAKLYGDPNQQPQIAAIVIDESPITYFGADGYEIIQINDNDCDTMDQDNRLQ